MTDYQATFSFLYEPETQRTLNIEAIQEAASDYLCDKLDDFFGFGFQDNVKIIELFASRTGKTMVTFKMDLSTTDADALENIADEFKIIGEE